MTNDSYKTTADIKNKNGRFPNREPAVCYLRNAVVFAYIVTTTFLPFLI